MTGLPLEPINIQVRLLDASGNRGATATEDIVLLPVLDPVAQQPSGGTNTINLTETAHLSRPNLPSRIIARAGDPVQLRSSSEQTYETETDADGKASFRNVPDGIYEVTHRGTTETVSLGGGATAARAAQQNYELTDAEYTTSVFAAMVIQLSFHGNGYTAIGARSSRRTPTRQPTTRIGSSPIRPTEPGQMHSGTRTGWH